MKNRTKTISLLVAVCMMLTLLPAVAFAAPMENITVTNITAKDDGFLAGFTLTYDVGKSSWGNNVNKATVRIGLQTQKFEGTFNEYGAYAVAHNYTTWPDTPADCGFVAWGGQPFERAATGATSQTANIAFDDSVNVGPGTYYVYAWTLWEDAPYSKIYPDAYICEFTVGSDGTVTEDDFDVNSDGGGSTPTPTPTPTPSTSPDTTDPGNTNPTPTPDVPTVDASSGIDLWYNGGNSFGSSKSAVPTSVEIDGVPVSFVGDGRSFTVSCIEPGNHWITVRWHSTSVTTNFTADASVVCIPNAIPKTGDMPIWAAIVEFLGF